MEDMDGADKFMMRLIMKNSSLMNKVSYLEERITILEGVNQMLRNTDDILARRPVPKQDSPLTSELTEQEPVLDTTQPPITLVKKRRGRPARWLNAEQLRFACREAGLE
jgi:hypothetical protein